MMYNMVKRLVSNLKERMFGFIFDRSEKGLPLNEYQSYFLLENIIQSFFNYSNVYNALNSEMFNQC